MNREKLKKAISRQMGCNDKKDFLDIMRDVAQGGAQNGFPGFTYTRDAVKFYDKNAEEIWELVNEQADSMGMNPLKMISEFAEAKNVHTDSDFKNLLSWFTLEEIAQEYAE